ncbi:MAG: hypothetical protein Q7U66_16870 [Methylobacter sp.]|nr:hypothetical protein [Methylobacter sp.]
MVYQKHRKGTCAICGKTFACKDLLSGDVVRESIANQIRMDVPNWSSDSFICLSDTGRYRSQYVHSLLETENGELTSLEKEVLDSLSEHELLSKNIEMEFEQVWTLGERLADRIAGFGGKLEIFNYFLCFSVGLGCSEHPGVSR